MAEVGGSLGHILQRLGLPPGKCCDRENRSQHHKYRGGKKNIGDIVQNLGGDAGGGGDDDDSRMIRIVVDRNGYHISGIRVQSLDDAGSSVSTIFNDLMQIVLIQLHPLMVASGPGMRAENYVSVTVTNHCVCIRNL